MAHHCHATGCTTAVPPEMFMCKAHWFSLSGGMRNAIWNTYRAGQCDDWNPSAAYCRAAMQAVRAVAARENREPDVKLYELFLEGADH